ncbi:hypothetical protein JW826_01895 [Candidatus Woesearchaeota archaeon]|nr:hypothetical protein [Candidatus Woesearchaeota archaeon]
MSEKRYDFRMQRLDINIKLDSSKGLFFGRKLDYYDESYLEDQGYVSCSFVPIGKLRQEQVWILPAPPESLIHTFLVRNIRDELLKFTKDVHVYKAVYPDVIFQNRTRQIVALEIETGKNMKKHKRRLYDKFTEAKLKYGKNLFIVLTDSNMKRKYKSLFPNIKILVRTDLPAFFHSQFHIRR